MGQRQRHAHAVIRTVLVRCVVGRIDVVDAVFIRTDVGLVLERHVIAEEGQVLRPPVDRSVRRRAHTIDRGEVGQGGRRVGRHRTEQPAIAAVRRIAQVRRGRRLTGVIVPVAVVVTQTGRGTGHLTALVLAADIVQVLARVVIKATRAVRPANGSRAVEVPACSFTFHSQHPVKAGMPRQVLIAARAGLLASVVDAVVIIVAEAHVGVARRTGDIITADRVRIQAVGIGARLQAAGNCRVDTAGAETLRYTVPMEAGAPG